MPRRIVRIPTVVAFAAVVGMFAVTSTPAAAAGECPNETLRTGFSASLPDCRAYELVTPEVGALPISTFIGKEGQQHSSFDTPPASPGGESVIFDTNGSVQGEDATGHSDRYESVRGLDGWVTRYASIGANVPLGRTTFVGGSSPDHGMSILDAGLNPSEIGGYVYVRDQGLEPIAKGSLGSDTAAEGYLLTEGGTHIIFGPNVSAGHPLTPLEPDAPPAPIGAIYDRALGGGTTVVSLLPGDVTPAGDARYLGAAADGSAVVFEINGVVYVRRSQAVTNPIAYPGPGDRLECTLANQGSGLTEIQWLRDGLPIAGANGNVYEVQPGDSETAIQCLMREGSVASVSSPPALVTTSAGALSPPVATQAPEAPAPPQPQAGTVETCSRGSWNGASSFAYQWYLDGVAISGATADTYTVQAGDIPGRLQCTVEATNASASVLAGSAYVDTDPAPAGPAPDPVVDISGLLDQEGLRHPVASVVGVSTGGARVFYAQGYEGHEGSTFAASYGKLDVVDPATGATTTLADEGEIWPVNVSPDGSHAFYISTAVLSTNSNSFGQQALSGAYNLYVWTEAELKFIATVNKTDVADEGRPGDGGLYGLGVWAERFAGVNILGSFALGGRARDTSRTTADGSTFVFQTSADLAPGSDSQGHSEIYRYTSATGGLECISCNPTGTPATAPSELETIQPSIHETLPTSEFSTIPSVSPDGSTIVFETAERLLGADRNSAYDVYRWKNGELALISGGQGAEDSFLYGMSTNADDIFFFTYDSLVPQDHDGGNASIYDARVDGGFPPEAARPSCQGEECQGPPAPAPGASATPTTATVVGSGNVQAPKKKPHEKKRPKHKKKHGHKKKRKGHDKQDHRRKGRSGQ